MSVADNKVRRLWQAGEPAFCGWMTSSHSIAAELYAKTGYDAVCLDMQHGVSELCDVPSIMQAIDLHQATPFVRLAELQSATIMKVLDMGAEGLICPLINTAEDAARLVEASSYPPVGGRSYGVTRGRMKGVADYQATANRQIIRFAMIETAQGLENVSEICQTEGLDGIFIGPSDLAIALGYNPGPDLSISALEEAISHCFDVAKSAGKKVGIFCVSGTGAAARRKAGFDLVVPSNEIILMTRILQQELASAKDG